MQEKQEQHPSTGGSWMRDPKTGELTQVEEATKWEAPEAQADTGSAPGEPVAASDPEAPAEPVTETAAAEPINSSEAAPEEAPAPSGRRNK